MALRFDNQVAVITGAGGGLGRAYALRLSSLGAKILVNDLGGALAGGQDGNSRAADKVVDEIKKAGGVAAANYDSVEHGDRIIAAAINAFGRVDILINNAGILRDRTVAKMSEQDWDLIMLVHLKGSFNCTKAAWPHMVKQNYGRIINTASAAGLYGNFGQANYSAAKLGLVGFTKSIAAEGARKNIFANVIAPLAGTRMTETILPKEIVDALKPEFIAPVVAYLCHSSCKDNGSVFECGAGYVAKLRWQRTQGHLFPKGFTPDDVAREWMKIGDFTREVNYPTSLQESTELMTQALETMGPSSESQSNSSSSKGATASSQQQNANQTKAEKLFALMGAYMSMADSTEIAKICKKVDAKFFFNITEKKKGPVMSSWTIDLKDGKVIQKQDGSADATFTMTEPDFLKVCLGKQNPQIAFMQGKMQIKGNMRAATKFTPDLFPKISEDLLDLSVTDAISKYIGQQGLSAAGIPTATDSNSTATPAASGTGTTSDISGTGLKSEPLIQFMQRHLATPAGKKLCEKVGCVYQFDVAPSKGAAAVSFTIDLKNSPPSMKKGAAGSCDAQFTMVDKDFTDVVMGKLNPQIAFMQGKMKIKGNMRAATKFTPDLFPKPSSL